MLGRLLFQKRDLIKVSGNRIGYNKIDKKGNMYEITIHHPAH